MRPDLIFQIRDVAVIIALRVCIPAAILLSTWQLEGLSWRLGWLPVIGVIVLLSGFLVGYVLSNLFGMVPVQRAVYAPAGGFTNFGAAGSLVVVVFLGESGLALLPLFKLFEEVVYYALFFPYAAKFSPNDGMQRHPRWRDPILLSTSLAVCVGLLLNVLGVTRPDGMQLISGVVVPVGTFSLMITVGLVFRFGTVPKYWKEAVALAFAKQLCLPLIALALVFLTGLTHAYDGLLVQVVVVLAMMPMAFTVMLPAGLYNLDQDLANACWLASMVSFLCVLPLVPRVLTLVAAI